jgi:hypothetical protein
MQPLPSASITGGTICPMPANIRQYFDKIEDFRKTTSLPPISNHDNHSTLALLVTDQHVEVWGINRKTAGIPVETMKAVKEVLRDSEGKSAHPVVLTHAESDALISACQKGINSTEARMFVDRKLCGFCGGKDFNGGSLRRLLALINCTRLTVYTPDGEGHYIEVVLTDKKNYKGTSKYVMS